MSYRMPKITPRVICKICGNSKKAFLHDHADKSYGHKYVPHRETEVEAAYRQGYEDGYARAEDRAHWGMGWD